ncbi:MAG TPA: acylphosphatase [Burkholderiales bacterium]|jgi:acylphosphatase|nr:acylphosphatase [Burkholderiales bacterium]
MESPRFHGGIRTPEEILQLQTIQLRITGRVQGVGYREALRSEAERLGVTGWVRNRSDGSVEALAQGSASALATFIAWARRGPPAARVEDVSTAPPDPRNLRAYATFERWPSA